MCLPVSGLSAHPHAWIDVTVDLLFDASGSVTGIRETWLFDDYYTAFVLEELSVGEGGRLAQADIDGLMRENMKNLKEYDYFTKVYRGDGSVPFAPVTEMSSSLEGNRLSMTFVIPFESKIDPATSGVTYSIYDPTYYIEMLHAEVDDPVRLENAPAGCTYRLIDPIPTMEALSLAATLDRTQRASDSLGAQFAERVEIRCP
jgi:ABC-type uncharacterized transport system substrate-binding protein